jgi:hypothetical protein
VRASLQVRHAPILKDGLIQLGHRPQFVLDDIHAAHAYMMQSEQFGKIAFSPLIERPRRQND